MSADVIRKNPETQAELLLKIFGKTAPTFVEAIAEWCKEFTVWGEFPDTWCVAVPKGYESFFVEPLTDATEASVLIPSNGYHGTLSPEAVGIVATLFVFNQLCFKYPDSAAVDKMFYDLRSFASEHNEARKIFAAID